jgi:hypothetical protein
MDRKRDSLTHAACVHPPPTTLKLRVRLRLGSAAVLPPDIGLGVYGKVPQVPPSPRGIRLG